MKKIGYRISEHNIMSIISGKNHVYSFITEILTLLTNILSEMNI